MVVSFSTSTIFSYFSEAWFYGFTKILIISNFFHVKIIIKVSFCLLDRFNTKITLSFIVNSSRNNFSFLNLLRRWVRTTIALQTFPTFFIHVRLNSSNLFTRNLNLLKSPFWSSFKDNSFKRSILKVMLLIFL